MTEVEEYHESKKYISKEELEKQLERLTAEKRPVEARDPFPVGGESKKISKEELDKLTERLYTQSLQQKEANMKELEARAYGESSRPKSGEHKLSSEELEANVNHLYTESLAKKKMNMEASRKKYHYEPQKSTKTVDRATFVQHMYNDRIEAKKKTEQKLYEKYIVPTEIKSTKQKKVRPADEAPKA